MDDMVERVALAICRNNGYKTLESPLDYTGDSGADSWRETARAAIAAMREPTREMVEAAECASESWEHVEATWWAMIDAALAKAPSPTS